MRRNFSTRQMFFTQVMLQNHISLSQLTLFCCKICFVAIYAVWSQNLFSRNLRASVWRKIEPEIVLVEKKRQISGMWVVCAYSLCGHFMNSLEENLEGNVSLRKKAKPSPMKTIQPSMWLHMLPVWLWRPRMVWKHFWWLLSSGRYLVCINSLSRRQSESWWKSSNLPSFCLLPPSSIIWSSSCLIALKCGFSWCCRILLLMVKPGGGSLNSCSSW